MHPEHQADAVCSAVGFPAESEDFVCGGEYRLPNHVYRKHRLIIQRCRDPGGVLRDFGERFRAVKMLAAGDEPDFFVF